VLDATFAELDPVRAEFRCQPLSLGELFDGEVDADGPSGRPDELITTSPKSTSASAPGRWVCGKNTLIGPRPASALIFGLRSAT
jgi:hypothetical protein